MMNKISNILTWIVSHKCNYNCHFCDRYDNNMEDISKEDCYKIIDFINIITSNDIKLDLFGGETTLFPYFFDILDNINRKNISIFTNLSCSNDIITKLIDRGNISIIATYHAQYMDPKEFYDKIKILYDNGIKIKVTFTLENQNEEYVKNKYYTLYSELKKFPDILIRVYNQYHINNYSILKMFDDNIYNKNLKIIEEKIFCYKNYMCIESNGDIYQCLSASGQKNINKPLYNCLKTNALKMHKMFCNMKLKCNCTWCCE